MIFADYQARSALQTINPSGRSLGSNQVRLVLHTVAYWRMLTMHDVIPGVEASAGAGLTTLRMRLFKIAAWIAETATPAAVGLRPRKKRQAKTRPKP